MIGFVFVSHGSWFPLNSGLHLIQAALHVITKTKCRLNDSRLFLLLVVHRMEQYLDRLLLLCLDPDDQVRPFE
jgi:hypothetical protein